MLGTYNLPSSVSATSQVSRFHCETLDHKSDINIKDVTLAVGERELLSTAHLRLKEGVKYAFIGRNGTGKSTLCAAIAAKIIPGLSSSLRILLLSQVDDAERATPQSNSTVLEHVLQGDVQRQEALRKLNLLNTVLESASHDKIYETVQQLRIEKLAEELEQARLVARLRSGARGKTARTAELKAEEDLENGKQQKASGDDTKEALDMVQELTASLELMESSTAEVRAKQVLTGLGFSEATMNKTYSQLSGGWRSRASLATALIVACDLLILDEPSNFLDIKACIWLERYLQDLSHAVVLISHDQALLDAVAEETIILRDQTLHYFEGTPFAYQVEEMKKKRKLTKQKDVLDKKKETIQNSIQQAKSSAKKTGDDNRLKMAKSRQKKLDERFGVEVSAKGGRFKLNRDLAGYHYANRAEAEEYVTEAPIKLVVASPQPLRTAGSLVHLDNVSIKFIKADKPLLSDISFTIQPGSRTAFIGANGEGKSTLAKIIVGKSKITSGTVSRHSIAKIAYYSQHSVEELNKANDAAGGGVSALSYFLAHFEEKGKTVTEQDARSCLGSFGLKGGTASATPISALSGGQKVRLALSVLLYEPPDILVLDEVTTHLDAATIQAFAGALDSYTGAIVLITHDRFFCRVVIEGASVRQTLTAAVGEEDSDSEEEELKELGKVYLVAKGKIKALDGGVDQYVSMVEKKLNTV